jgi:hypothetical protein
MAKNVSLVAAEGVLTFAADPANTDTVTIGDQIYEFVTTPADANDVDVAGTRAASILNLIAAINLTGTAGATTYDVDTVINPYVSAVLSDTDEVTLTARVPGAQGNGVTTTTSETDIVFAAATLENGAGHLPTFISGLLTLNPVGSELQMHLKELTEAAD